MPLRCFFGHHRSASTWIHGIVRAVCAEMGWTARIVNGPQTFDHDLGAFLRKWPTDFLICTNAQDGFVSQLRDFVGFHVVRDPRDIVVSSYFAHRYSHPTEGWDELVEHRERLGALSKDDGLMLEITECRREQFAQMAGWDYGRDGVHEAKMEHLIRDPYRSFLEIFEFLGMLDGAPGTRRRLLLAAVGAVNLAIRRRQAVAKEWLNPTRVRPHRGRRLSRISAERLLGVVHGQRFARQSGGRAPGEEDVRSHWRKGVAGDWRNHFSPEHVRAFKQSYDPLLLALGYEKSADWSATATAERVF